MNWFSKLLVLALILCLSRIPIPWGHSHSEMDAEQLAVHLHQYHPATTESELPKGFHWHVVELDLTSDGEEGENPVAVLRVSLGDSLMVPMPDPTNAAFTPQTLTSRTSVSTDSSLAHAVRQQRTYLRLNVLLI